MTKAMTWNDKDEIVSLLKKGEVVAFPTETVYGLGVISTDEQAFQRLVGVKKRPPEKPFTLMCANLTQVMQYAEMDVHVLALMHAFMPGEITLLLRPRKNIPHWVTLDSPFIGVRVPALGEVREMIEACGAPLLVPSANLSGDAPALNGKQAMDIFHDQIAAVVEGECVGKTPSTIVAVDESGVRLVREGPISFLEIEKVYREASFSVAIGCDHGAYDLKEKIKEHLLSRGFSVLDEGTHSKASCDYPIYAAAVGRDVARKEAELGIVCCTSGEGISMAANKIKGVRCGVGYDDVVVGKMREHNDANVVAFGAAYMKEEDVLRRVDIFLAETFSILEKHHRRVAQIVALEK